MIRIFTLLFFLSISRLTATTGFSQVKSDLPHANAYCKSGIAKFDHREFADAKKDFEICVSDDSTDREAWLYLGFCNYNLKNFESAMVAFDKVLSYDYNNFPALKFRAESKRAAGQFVSAVKDYNRAITLSLKASTTNDNAFLYFGRGYCYSKNGLHDLSISDFTIAINLQPKENYWYKCRAYEYYDLAKYGDTVKDLNAYFNLGGKDPKVYGHRAYSLIQLCNTNNLQPCNQAISDLIQYQNVNAGDRRINLMFAIAYGMTKDSLKSRKYFEKIVLESPEDTQTKFMWSAMEINAHNYRKALELLMDVAPKITVPFSELPYRVGFCKAALKDTLGALKEYSDALQIDSIRKEVYRARIKLLLSSTKYERQALSDLNKLIAIDTDRNSRASYYSCLAFLDLRKSTAGSAFRMIDSATKLEPRAPMSLSIRSLLEVHGNIEKAVLNSKKASELENASWEVFIINDYILRIKFGHASRSGKMNAILKHHPISKKLFLYIYEKGQLHDSLSVLLAEVVVPFLKEAIVNLP